VNATPFRFSIIVPTYNRRDILLDTVASVAATVRPWPCELIVVIDGSTDGTAEALGELVLPLPIKVVDQPNRGAAAARNAGAAVARGRFLLFLDDDMIVEPDLLIEHDKTLLAGADAVFGPAEDGGWWALGLRDPGHAEVLRDIPTSTPETGARTRDALRRRGLRVADLPRLRDVDTAPDAYAVAALCPPGRSFPGVVAAEVAW